MKSQHSEGKRTSRIENERGTLLVLPKTQFDFLVDDLLVPASLELFVYGPLMWEKVLAPLVQIDPDYEEAMLFEMGRFRIIKGGVRRMSPTLKPIDGDEPLTGKIVRVPLCSWPMLSRFEILAGHEMVPVRVLQKGESRDVYCYVARSELGQFATGEWSPELFESEGLSHMVCNVVPEHIALHPELRPEYVLRSIPPDFLETDHS